MSESPTNAPSRSWSRRRVEEPGIWFLSGRIFATLDADDNPASIHVMGKLVDLCARLGR